MADRPPDSGFPSKLQLEVQDTYLLDSVEIAWSLLKGSVEVFSTLVVDGKPSGKREYLFTRRVGDILCGSTVEIGEGKRGLVLLALSPCELEPISLDDLCARLSGEEDSLAHLFDEWIDGLWGPLEREMPQEKVLLTEVRGVVELDAGWQLPGSRSEGLWIQLTEGQVHLAGRSEAEHLAGGGWLALGRRGWLQAPSPSRIDAVLSAELPGRETVVSGLENLLRYVGEWIDGRSRRRNQRDLEQLRARESQEEQATTAAFDELGSVIERHHARPHTGTTPLISALLAIGDHQGIQFKGVNGNSAAAEEEESLGEICRRSGIRFRIVMLRDLWWKSDNGPLFSVMTESNHAIALLPERGGGYKIFDPRTNEKRVVDASVAESINPKAAMFFRPITGKIRGAFQFFKFGLAPLKLEFLLVMLFGMAGSLLGLLIPQQTLQLLDVAIPDSNEFLLWQAAVVLTSVAIGQSIFLFCQSWLTVRLQVKTTASLQSAVFDWILRLPATFFRKYSNGDLLNRLMLVSQISNEIGATALRSLVVGTLSLVNLGLLFYYSSQLALVALVIGIVSCSLTAYVSTNIRKIALKIEILSGTLFGFVYQTIMGITKIRSCGAEKRVFHQWTMRFTDQLRLFHRQQEFEDIVVLFNIIVPTLTALLIFWLASALMFGEGGLGSPLLTIGTFVAFNTALGQFLAGATSATETFVRIIDNVNKVALLEPILQTDPETDASSANPGRLKGKIELESVSFRYREDGPLILDSLSLQVNPGEFVALVGTSGCGKSTIFRLLLGFESPQTGDVLFDGQNLNGLDVTRVRRQIGVVLQETRVTAGSIYELVCGNSQAPLEEVWQALRDAAIADEVEELPMGIHTIVSEGGSNFSGGQRQRLLIAQALIQKPSMLLFDEATSALDNRAQQLVTDSLNRRRVSRVTVAHRLSTIEAADRIYVLDAGKVIQCGNFEELVAVPGLFRKLVERQQAEPSSASS